MLIFFMSPAIVTILFLLLFLLVTIIVVVDKVQQKRTDNISENSQTQTGNPVFIVQNKSNGIGTAGFVLALIGLLFFWVPVIKWILWFLGAIFSIVGCFKEPRGLAIAGVVISFIGIILIIAFVGALASLLT
jgi:hypothetical protein